MSNRDVFINCPFSSDYDSFFQAIVFAVIRCGFKPRCALETDDSSENRFDKICQIIAQCDFGIHDISKTEPDSHSSLPRFNMPLELGLFLAAKKFGDKNQKRKRCIIFENRRYEYQKYMSDISGQDIHSHNRSISKMMASLVSWLRREAHDEIIPGGAQVLSEYRLFQRQLPQFCREIKIKQSELEFTDFRKLVQRWLISSPTS